MHVWFHIYLFRLVISNPIKICCLFIKHFINATTFKIIRSDVRKRVLGQLAVPTRKAPRLNFSVPECFWKELEYWWKGFAISNFLNFNMTCSILANLRLKGDWIGFFRIDTFQVWAETTCNKDLEKVSATAVLDKDENLLWSGLQWHRNCHSNEMTPLLFYLRPYFSAVETAFPKSFTETFFSNSFLDVPEG